MLDTTATQCDVSLERIEKRSAVRKWLSSDDFVFAKR
jgi:hypothetical protein